MRSILVFVAFVSVSACGDSVRSNDDCEIREVCCSLTCSPVSAQHEDQGCDVVCDSAVELEPEADCVARAGECVWE